MLNVMSSITIPCVLVSEDTPAIRNTNATSSQLHVRIYIFLFRCGYPPPCKKFKTIPLKIYSAVASDTPAPVTNPCVPSPCGEFAQCNDQNGVAVCKCLPNYYGNPPSCRPECTTNSDCSNTKACVNERCVDPCPGACGLNTVCNVINHRPNCACRSGYEGDAFVRCQPIVVARKHRSHPAFSPIINSLHPK